MNRGTSWVSTSKRSTTKPTKSRSACIRSTLRRANKATRRRGWITTRFSPSSGKNLHGGGGSPERQWGRVGATLVDAMEQKRVRPMIYVFAEGLGNTLFVDTAGTKKQVETTVIKELIPFIDANYRTITAREGRAIDGFSMGGFGALMLSMKHPELFSSAVSYGAAVVTFDVMSAGIKRDAFGDNAEHFAKFDPRAWLARNADAVRKGVRVRMVCGMKDDLYPANINFKELLEQHKIPLSWQTVEGVGHDTKGLYHAVGLESLRFIEAGFGK